MFAGGRAERQRPAGREIRSVSSTLQTRSHYNPRGDIFIRDSADATAARYAAISGGRIW